MKRTVKNGLAWIMVAAVVISSISMPIDTQAASKAKVKSVLVTNIKNKKLTLSKGSKFQLKVNIKVSPNKAKYKKVHFVSSKKGIATVSSKGNITAKKVGTTNISVISTTNKKKKIVIKVTVKKATTAPGGNNPVSTPPVENNPVPTPLVDNSTPPPSTGTTTPEPTTEPTAIPTITPTIAPTIKPTPEPDSKSTLSRKPFAEAAYVGETLADVNIVGGSILDSNGNEIHGSYSWVAPATKLSTTGNARYEAKFIPSNSHFEEIEHVSITVLVCKERVILTFPKTSGITTSQTLAMSALTGGAAVDTAGNNVAGSFTWADNTIIPGQAGTQTYSVVFTPANLAKYRRTTCYVGVQVTGTKNENQSTTNVLDGSSLKLSFEDIFGKVGMAIEKSQLNNSTVVNFAKTHYNSLTMGNEMKPDYLLSSWSPKLENSNPAGYVDPATFKHEYKDTKYPKIDMDAIDSYIKTAYANGMKMRYHVFIWHAQTPKWFFKEGFSTNDTSAFVTPEVMDGRLEYLIRNVMTHIYNLQDENNVYIGREVIDSWDIANEYFHNHDKGYKAYWDEVYYPEYTYKANSHSGILTPTYIKEAFAIAYSILEDYELTDSVSLLFNEFNTYMEGDKIVKMINYFNTKDDINPTGERICSGIGMQMHLDMGYPTVDGIRTGAIEKFRNAGFEIQITEFDLTDYVKAETTQSKQIEKWYNLMGMLMEEKDKGAKITGITWWGPSDQTSWRKTGVPLLFSNIGQAKEHYFKVIEAVSDYNEDALMEW